MTKWAMKNELQKMTRDLDRAYKAGMSERERVAHHGRKSYSKLMHRLEKARRGWGFVNPLSY